MRIILSSGFALTALLLASCGDSRSTSQSTDHEEAGYHHTPGVWVTILTQPVTQIVVAPAAATFAVVVDASSGTEVRYQWSANLPGSNLPVSVGENSNQYTTDPTGTTPLLNGTAISVMVTATRDGQSATVHDCLAARQSGKGLSDRPKRSLPRVQRLSNSDYHP